MGKGGSNEVKETAAQKAQAEVAKKQWDLYQSDLRQYEDIFMNKVDNLNSQEQYDKIAGTAALGTAQSFGAARQGLSDGMAASGIDPTSGRYQEAMRDLETEQALSQTDNVNRAQSSQQDRYVAGLQDVASIGQGQKAEALQGYSDLAASSLSKAASNAQAALATKQATSGAIGSLAGAYGAYKLNQMNNANAFNAQADKIEARGAFTGSSTLNQLYKN